MSAYSHVTLVRAWPEGSEQPWTYTSRLKYIAYHEDGMTLYREENSGATVEHVEAFEEWLRKIQEVSWDAGFNEGRDDLDAAAVARDHGEDQNPHRI